MNNALKILLATLVVFALVSCGKNSRDYFGAITPDSVKMVVLFEVDSLVTSEQAANELRYQSRSFNYAPSAVVWVGGSDDSLESFRITTPWRRYIKAKDIFDGIHVVRNLFLADNAAWLAASYRGVCYVSKSKMAGGVKDSINRYLLWNVYNESDLLSQSDFAHIQFGYRARKK